MGENLRARLRRIREASQRTVPPSPSSAVPDMAAFPDWTPVGFQSLKRSVFMAPSMAIPANLPRSLGILVPDLLRYPSFPLSPPGAKNLLFFDLETTGLSTGPGTLAFLAAFGRLTEAPLGGSCLRVDQYLLLDYPGENDFLEAILKEFSASSLVISYNGKSFDSQLLKIRCLMNGIRPPEYYQADLLHPSRRLWKRVLPSCSQASIETAILDMDRSGDIPGSMAPDIWFSFLKTGDPRALMGICDHNARDILGLLAILGALCGIAEDPRGGGEKFRCDPESLALWWHRAVRIFGEKNFGPGTAKTGEALLQAAAEKGHRRAAYTYYRKLAIEAEWKRRDPALALGYVNSFLALLEIQDTMGEEMFRRRERLVEKIEIKGKLL
ncbi:ribonuclease H-like domain-containing protein [Treponema primitia]|uniref:ribonuclease H-like domain-containing protein n=1 Tax=Treponema primitia TaxID=88058 RepID=UPI00397F712D